MCAQLDQLVLELDMHLEYDVYVLVSFKSFPFLSSPPTHTQNKNLGNVFCLRGREEKSAIERERLRPRDLALSVKGQPEAENSVQLRDEPHHRVIFTLAYQGLHEQEAGARSCTGGEPNHS